MNEWPPLCPKGLPLGPHGADGKRTGWQATIFITPVSLHLIFLAIREGFERRVLNLLGRHFTT
jgi:hypothetical protein